MENLVKLTIDGVSVEVPAGTTVLEAAKKAGINIPTLCYLKDINQIGACRMCIVDTGARAFGAACVLPVSNGMNVKTNTPKIREARRVNLELLLSNHDKKCLECARNQKCELQQLCQDLGVEDVDKYKGKINEYDIDDLSPSIVRNNNKCILCRRCVAACNNTQAVGVIGPMQRGFKTKIGSAWEMPLNDAACINCGQCIAACPTGALYEKDSTKAVWNLLADETKHVVVQPAPAVRAALGEEFGIPMGTSVTGKMAAALRRLGFEKVFDTDWAADLTIMEEGTEFIGRLKNGGTLPMITSCSPGWIKFCETYYPDFIPNLSSCKSPHEMEGAMIKSYWAEKEGIDPKDIRVVSVMPCTAKKFEARRPELSHNGMQDVDEVITTRELAKMIKEAGIDFVNLPDEDFDPMLGESTGAGVIFGATGGVMEAALRTVYEKVTGKTLDKVDFEAVRGTEGIKEATVKVERGGCPRHRERGEAAGQRPQRREDLPLHRGHGMPRRLRNRRRTAHRFRPEADGMRSQGPACRGPVQRGREQAAAEVPRECLHHGGVQGLPGRAQQPSGPRAAAYPLYSTPEVQEVIRDLFQAAHLQKCAAFLFADRKTNATLP